jgi:TusA-related sulfurtransferase
MDDDAVNDFTELTCTNLMIKLKILLTKLTPGDTLTFFATREQVDNTCAPFSSNGYQVAWNQEGENRYLVRIGK